MTQPTPTDTTLPAQPEPQSEESKTFTQADIDRIVAERVKRAKPADYDEARRKAAEFDKLQEATQSEAEKAAKAAAETERRASEAEAKALRLEVAFEKGLTPAQAKRLVGSSREELEADADDILENFPVKTDGRPKGNADQGVRSTPPPSDPRLADIAQIEADLNAGRRK